jgi:DNA (cytosine-5)-methyltransferase 1
MLSFGSVCSGIEASQLAFLPFGFNQLWSSEIADFPSKVLEHHYPDIPNVGNMLNIPQLILDEKIEAPDLFCGGTPCQAFSLAGWKTGLLDERGQLTITFIEIANAIDKIRINQKKAPAMVLWENVEGVLNDRTNAFGNFIAGLAGFVDEIQVVKWSKAGYLEGPLRNVAWRVLDAKHFGLSQQRKRLYVLAGGKDSQPDKILFELDKNDISKKPNVGGSKTKIEVPNLFNDFQSPIKRNIENVFYKNGSKFEVFREYTDCLYAAYGTKWNGNAAAYNGSLYVAQNDRLRRLTPLECERLMGMPDNYTLVKGNKDTTRYQAIGNSWAVPVIKWIGHKIEESLTNPQPSFSNDWKKVIAHSKNNLNTELFLLGTVVKIDQSFYLNTSASPNEVIKGNLQDVVQDENVPGKLYLSPLACKGILRRKEERDIKMNRRLEEILGQISSELIELKTA